MGKTMFGGTNKKTRAKDRQQQIDRTTEQARQLNEQNKALDAEAATARGGRRGRRLLAYRGQEAGLRDKLAA